MCWSISPYLDDSLINSWWQTMFHGCWPLKGPLTQWTYSTMRYQCQISEPEYDAWHTTNSLIRSILITNMTKEVAIQMSHLKITSEVWDKAQRLFSGQTMTDFTLTIMFLITLKYVDGEDPAAHIVKMWGLHWDLMLMNRDIDNGLFACFLWISMLPSWNYIFSGLPQAYTSAKIERWIKDEHGIKSNQESAALA